MLTCWGQRHRFCDGLSRREFLRAGALGLGGLTLAELLRRESSAESTNTATRQKSVIYVVLGGGPSHIDMYDLKPLAPVEYRGPFQPIATSLPGVDICELMPRQAKMMHELALVRGIRSVENDHYLSEVYTGLPRIAGKRPAFGSVVSRLAGSQSLLPPYVSLDEVTVEPFEYEKPHYAGASHAPFRPFGPSIEDMTPVKSVDRLQDRRELLSAFDGMRRRIDRQEAASGLDPFTLRALEIITSPRVRDAFDLSKESPETLLRYGKGKYPHQTVKDIMYDWDVKPFIRARRLVEAGARVVTLRVGSWDHHSGPQSDIFFALRCLLPVLDQSIEALVTDLRDRGLDRDVLVVVLGEFGRTPKISPLGPGREHWADAGCALFY
ncbi:MAG: DUF1501 domain-containing protein, partial [Planctomycetia bacterium]|nr:DUF1501 domain-containing protein [Planctomycetia bacterium]